jgi:hypothetical protein
MDNQSSNPIAGKVRTKALEVLGQIGNQESIEVILRIATYSKESDPICLSARLALARRGSGEGVDLFLDMIDPDKSGKAEGQQQMGYPASDSKSKQEIALLGLSRAGLNDVQVTRAIGLVKKLGEKNSATGQSGPADLQENLFLSLLAKAQGPTLKNLAGLIAEEPASSSAGSQTQDPYYWNRSGSGDGLDKAFLKMVNVLDQIEQFEDEEAVTQFITAIMRREEALLAPKEHNSDQWNPDQYLIKFEDTRRDRRYPGMNGAPEMNFMPITGPASVGPAMGAASEAAEMGADPSMTNQKMKIPNMPGMPRREMQFSANPESQTSPLSFLATGTSRSSRPTSRDNQDLRFLDLTFPSIRQNSGRTEQQASLAGINLVSRLKNARQFL